MNCPYFPSIECDSICELACRQSGELIRMRRSGVPECELSPMEPETFAELMEESP